MRRENEIDLGGAWRFRLDPQNLGEHYPEQLDIPWCFDARWMNLDHDERQWSAIRVPSCWQVEGYDYNGMAWYRREFPSPLAGESDRRAWLRFDGVDYFSDVWLNEIYLGSHEGYFSAFGYEITPYLRPDGNLLAVRVDSPNDIRAKEAQRGQLKGLIKGALQRWDVNNPEVNPGGIWNDVKLFTTGPGAIQDLRLQTFIPELPDLQSLHKPVAAGLRLEVQVAGREPGGLRLHSDHLPAHPGNILPARLVVRVRKSGLPDVLAEAAVTIQITPALACWNLSIKLPQAFLWFTWDLGEPHLYELEVVLEVSGVISDKVFSTFGFRVIERRSGWELLLNGVRFYQRGANYLSDQFLSSMDETRYARDVELALEANLNTLHPFAVVEKQAFYDECDRRGLLVYQDFPMWLTVDNSSDLVRRAGVQLQELIAQFYHHPSIAIWNFGSQPSVANFQKLGSALTRMARQLDPCRIAHQANAMLDRHDHAMHPLDDYKWQRKRIKEFQEKYDWRVDTHQYYGWYWAEMSALKDVPLEDLELVTEYGAQALPCREHLIQIIPARALFPPDWPAYTRRCFQPEMQFEHIPRPASLDEMIQASQAYQCRFIQYHTEYYRRHKFSPNNGAHYFCFNDCWPAITWSVVDYDRRKKPGFYALQRAMAPLQVFLAFDGPIQQASNSQPEIWIVNDLLEDFHPLTLSWEISRGRGSGSSRATGRLACDVAANSIQRIGRLGYPFEAPGAYHIELRLVTQDRRLIENDYDLQVE